MKGVPGRSDVHHARDAAEADRSPSQTGCVRPIQYSELGERIDSDHGIDQGHVTVR